MVKNLQIPISEQDKTDLEQKAKELKISVAGYCRLILFSNINVKEVTAS